MNTKSHHPWVASLIAAAVLCGSNNGPNTVVVVEAFSAVTIHAIDNVPCRELRVAIPGLADPITLLEATLAGQEILVDEVLRTEDERGGAGERQRQHEPEDPYGSVLWPAAAAVAEYIIGDGFWQHDNDEARPQRPTLLELGTGTGLVALAASASRKYSSILATDYETVPLQLLEAASHLNHQQRGRGERNSRITPISTALFDVCDLATPLPAADVVCAADILYETSTGVALAHRTLEALARGSRVVIGCSPERPGRPAFLEELRRSHAGLKDARFVEVAGTTCTGARNSLICGPGSASVSAAPEVVLLALLDLTPECLA